MLALPTIDPTGPVRRLPAWLKRKLPRGHGNFYTEELLRELRLETVCENARCPNRPECYSRRTATFMILGNVCTRPCGFCSVPKGTPENLEADEPDRVAEAARRLGLKHVVITSVTRDDLPDGRRARFHKGGVRLNFHLLGSLADLKNDIDFRTVIDLEDNPALQICPESRQSGLHHIGSNRKAGENIVAGFI